MWEIRERQKILWIILENEAIWNDLSESYEKAAERAYAIVSDYLENSSR